MVRRWKSIAVINCNFKIWVNFFFSYWPRKSRKMVTRGRKSNRKSNDPKHSSSWVKVFGEKRNFMLLRRSSFSHKNVGRDRCWDGFHPHKFVRYLEQSTAHVHGRALGQWTGSRTKPPKRKKKWKITDGEQEKTKSTNCFLLEKSSFYSTFIFLLAVIPAQKRWVVKWKNFFFRVLQPCNYRLSKQKISMFHFLTRYHPF